MAPTDHSVCKPPDGRRLVLLFVFDDDAYIQAPVSVLWVKSSIAGFKNGDVIMEENRVLHGTLFLLTSLAMQTRVEVDFGDRDSISFPLSSFEMKTRGMM
eukprot:TRINITY_DN18780_c0_g1_i2.p2 TRINITY_DN18780_c0_g1~~TRINITY_DN18780_c0_g1_i2.p2  ORF type:complete len:100 (+),score=4.17 TRINITY_DN18780_c0_g1_i2:504-803(+)